MQIRLKEGQIIAGPDVEYLGKGVHEVPDHVAAGLAEAGHIEGTRAADKKAK